MAGRPSLPLPNGAWTALGTALGTGELRPERFDELRPERFDELRPEASRPRTRRPCTRASDLFDLDERTRHHLTRRIGRRAERLDRRGAR